MTLYLHNYFREGGEKLNKSKQILTKCLRCVRANCVSKNWNLGRSNDFVPLIMLSILASNFSNSNLTHTKLSHP